ncbi:MFS transporter [Paenibacillus lemnae]|nr:MFS transporter [Paenibacillus lemnae]
MNSSSVRLSREASITLSNHGIYQFGNALAAILVNLYLWRLTNDVWVNGMYNLLTLASAPAATLLVGKLAKVKDRLLVYRLGIVLTAFFYLLILVAGEMLVNYYVAFAVLKGVSTSFYWLGHFTMIQDVSNEENRHRYLGLNLIITNAAMLAGPAVAGLLVDMFGGLRGYMAVYLLSFVMFAYASINSWKMSRKPSPHKTYYIKYSWQMSRKYPAFGRALAGWFVFGLPQGVLAYIPAILLYEAVPSESFVNYMNVLFLGVTMAAGFMLARWGSSRHNYQYLRMAAVGFIAGTIPLFFGISLWPVVLFMLLYSCVKPLQNNAYTAYYYDLSARLPLGEHFRVEAVVLREVCTNAGRSAGVIILMFLSADMQQGALAGMLMFAAVSQLLIGWLASPAYPSFRLPRHSSDINMRRT